MGMCSAAIPHSAGLPYGTVLPPSLEDHVEHSGACRQADDLGGDFYDVFPLPNGEIGIAIGDACGKGARAALIISHLRATLRAEARYNPTEVGAVLSAANRLLYNVCARNTYATLFYATFNPVTGLLKYSNAGHPVPFLLSRHGSNRTWLEAGGRPVGMFEESSYETGFAWLRADDLFIAYTDGITELPNVRGEEWGLMGLLEVLESATNPTPFSLCARIAQAIDAYALGTTQADDMTWFVLRPRPQC